MVGHVQAGQPYLSRLCPNKSFLTRLCPTRQYGGVCIGQAMLKQAMLMQVMIGHELKKNHSRLSLLCFLTTQTLLLEILLILQKIFFAELSRY